MYGGATKRVSFLKIIFSVIIKNSFRKGLKIKKSGAS